MLLVIHIIALFGFALVTASILGFVEALIHNIHKHDKRSDNDRIYAGKVYLIGIVLLLVSLILYHTLII